MATFSNMIIGGWETFSAIKDKKDILKAIGSQHSDAILSDGQQILDASYEYYLRTHKKLFVNEPEGPLLQYLTEYRKFMQEKLKSAITQKYQTEHMKIALILIHASQLSTVKELMEQYYVGKLIYRSMIKLIAAFEAQIDILIQIGSHQKHVVHLIPYNIVPFGFQELMSQVYAKPWSKADDLLDNRLDIIISKKLEIEHETIVEGYANVISDIVCAPKPLNKATKQLSFPIDDENLLQIREFSTQTETQEEPQTHTQTHTQPQKQSQTQEQPQPQTQKQTQKQSQTHPQTHTQGDSEEQHKSELFSCCIMLPGKAIPRSDEPNVHRKPALRPQSPAPTSPVPTSMRVSNTNIKDKTPGASIPESTKTKEKQSAAPTSPVTTSMIVSNTNSPRPSILKSTKKKENASSMIDITLTNFNVVDIQTEIKKWFNEFKSKLKVDNVLKLTAIDCLQLQVKFDKFNFDTNKIIANWLLALNKNILNDINWNVAQIKANQCSALKIVPSQ